MLSDEDTLMHLGSHCVVGRRLHPLSSYLKTWEDKRGNKHHEMMDLDESDCKRSTICSYEALEFDFFLFVFRKGWLERTPVLGGCGLHPYWTSKACSFTISTEPTRGSLRG